MFPQEGLTTAPAADAALIQGLEMGAKVIGAAGFAINGWWHGAWPSAALNVAWLLIGGVALWRIIRTDSSTSAM